jgi:hypothetical protein
MMVDLHCTHQMSSTIRTNGVAIQQDNLQALIDLQNKMDIIQILTNDILHFQKLTLP